MLRQILIDEIKKVFPDFDGKIRFQGDARGDYSINIQDKKIAQKIKEKLSDFEYISEIDIVGSYLNFWLSEKAFEEGIKFSLEEKFNFGKDKTQVEFLSANPTGELHIGHGRGGFYGDALSNILERSGYKIKREFYINDAKESTQIKELGKMVLGKGESYLTDYLKLKIGYLKKRVSRC